jgi:hypothetical protein
LVFLVALAAVVVAFAFLHPAADDDKVRRQAEGSDISLIVADCLLVSYLLVFISPRLRFKMPF